ncbi:MAG: hypothetical protein WC980_03900 [Candidatus Brocadiia bacterium]
MGENKVQLSEDTVAYVDKERHKLVIEIDLPESEIQPDNCFDTLYQFKQPN